MGPAPGVGVPVVLRDGLLGNGSHSCSWARGWIATSRDHDSHDDFIGNNDIVCHDNLLLDNGRAESGHRKKGTSDDRETHFGSVVL